MYTIYVVDPGYSLKASLDQWQLRHGQHNYPGHVLYGVNHMNPDEIEIVLEQKLLSYRSGFLGRLRYEFHNLFRVMMQKGRIDLVYLPFTNFGTLICLFKRLGIIRKPMVGLLHGVSTGRAKKVLYDTYFRGLDHIVFISQPVYQEFIKEYSEYANKASCLPLMPEQELVLAEVAEKDIDVISIGKTYREYQTLFRAVQGTDIECCIVDQADIQGAGGNIHVHKERIDYNTCRQLYHRSKINLVAVKEENGIFGLTSILDSFTMNIPMIATKTKFLSVPIEEMGIGIEVQPYDAEGMKRAIDKLLSDKEFYDTCKKNLKKSMDNGFNTACFANELCKIFMRLIQKE